MSRLKPTLLKPYFRKKVMRKPNPANTITCTSWKSAIEEKEKEICIRGALRKCDIVVYSIY